MKIKALLMTMLAALFLVTAACNESGRKSQADAVKQALQQADLKDVTVSDDADKNTVTLGGKLHSEDAKNRAGEVAKSAAPDRTIAHQTTYLDPPSQLVVGQLTDSLQHRRRPVHHRTDPKTATSDDHWK